MKLVRVSLKNFRAISELEIDVGDNTTLIGPNGVGKSCVLRGIEKFFSRSAAVTLEDFHDRNTNDPIEIGLTFADLQPDELQRFSTRVHGGKLQVVRVFHSNLGNRENGRYYGFAYRHPDFEQIRQLDGANAQKAAFNNLVDEGQKQGLQKHAKIDDVLKAMTDWESENTDQCVLARDDGQFEGFANVARGSLQKFISYVYVPAVRDAAGDAVDVKNSVIGQLIELLVKTVLQGKEEIKAFQKEVDDRYKDLVSPEKIGELGDLSKTLGETLKVFYGDSDVLLNWKDIAPLVIPLPTAETHLTEQGYTGPIEGKGHGLQRAFIFTILQHLALALHSTTPISTEGEEGAEQEPTSHSIIIAIEEPELYQHPTKQRHFARVLRELGSIHAHQPTSSVQLLVCSHSPHFLGTERFEEVRVVHRRQNNGDGSSISEVRQVTYQQVVDRLKEVSPDPDKGLDVEGLKVRLHTLNPTVSEGFFANLVVLVEGASDEAAIRAAVEMSGKSLEAQGVALLEVGGKTNIDKPMIIFQLLGIPTYCVFDSDGDKEGKERKGEANLQLQKLCGCEAPEEVRTHVCDQFASFETNLEKVLRAEIGADCFDKAVAEAGYLYGMDSKSVKKCPIPMRDVLYRCKAAGATSKTLDAITEKIVA